MKRAFFWLRWAAVLPTGVVAAVLLTFPVHWALLTMGEQGVDASGRLVVVAPEIRERLGSALVLSFGFVFFGSRVAPAFRTTAALMLSSAYVAVVVTLLTLDATANTEAMDYWQVGTGQIVASWGFMGAGLAAAVAFPLIAAWFDRRRE